VERGLNSWLILHDLAKDFALVCSFDLPLSQRRIRLRYSTHCEVKIVHTETGETMRLGEIGEICTRGYHVMHG
jgi:hypothetical protein